MYLCVCVLYMLLSSLYKTKMLTFISALPCRMWQLPAYVAVAATTPTAVIWQYNSTYIYLGIKQNHTLAALLLALIKF